MPLLNRRQEGQDIRTMARSPRVLIAGLVVVAAVGIYVTFSTMMKKSTTHPSTGTETNLYQESRAPGVPIAKRTTVHVYFVDKARPYLIAEERAIVPSDDPAQFGRNILDALIEGPEQELSPILPDTAGVNGLYVTPDGTAYVDLPESARTMYPGGSETELLTIYSIVNSLVLNIDSIEAVKMLIDGRESDTLAGHIDLRFPFRANVLMVR